MTQSYPLSWPQGWQRTPTNKIARSNFHKRIDRQWASGGTYKTNAELTISDGVEMLMLEVNRLGGRDIVLSTNLQLTTYGVPRSGQRLPDDRGCAVYFTLNGKPRVLACDKWDRVQDNMVAIAKHIDALRGQERWGVGSTEQAFAGYAALAAPSSWRNILGIPETAGIGQAELAYRSLARKHHPDMPGGSSAKMSELNRAIEQAREELPG